MSNPEAPHDDPTPVEQPVQTDQTQPDQTQSDTTEQLDRTDATRVFAFEEPQQPTSPDTTAWPPAVPDRPSGPHAPAIVLGLVCLAVAAIVLAQELGNLSVDWGNIGPIGIVAAGALLVLFGLAGLFSSRRKPH